MPSIRFATFTGSLFLAASALLAGPAAATNFNFTGTIKSITAHDSGYSARNVMYLNGFTSAGTCGVLGATGLVGLKIKMDDYGKSQYQMALAAFLAGKSVEVQVDDAEKDGTTWCWLRYIRVVSP